MKSEKKLKRLTSKQASALKTFILEPGALSGATGYSGRELGGTLSSLERNGFIEPFGREERQYKWEISDLDLISDVRDKHEETLNLLEKLSNSYA